jgi:glycosyltransferase involved in cell wall biosynthesis
MRVAIVHDYLTQRGGAERVVLAMRHAFPDAPLHTALYDPAGTFPEFAQADVRPFALNRVAPLRRNHRLALPVLAPAFSRQRIDAEVTLCSSSGWAHGVRTTGRKLVYCYAPARWLYQSDRYLRTAPAPVRAALATLRPSLLRWDRRAALGADQYVTLSRAVRRAIADAYGIEAAVIPPPFTLDPRGPQRPVAGLDPGFALCVARLLPYKNVDAVATAHGQPGMPRLVVVGSGPDEQRLRRLAPPHTLFLGGIDDDTLRWLYAHCEYLVAASHEDFGLTPLEAAAFGRPAVVLRFGGFLDTVREDDTGVFFDTPGPQRIADAVHRLRALDLDPGRIRRHADDYTVAAFAARLRELVDGLSAAAA